MKKQAKPLMQQRMQPREEHSILVLSSTSVFDTYLDYRHLYQEKSTQIAHRIANDTSLTRVHIGASEFLDLVAILTSVNENTNVRTLSLHFHVRIADANRVCQLLHANDVLEALHLEPRNEDEDFVEMLCRGLNLMRLRMFGIVCRSPNVLLRVAQSVAESKTIHSLIIYTTFQVEQNDVEQFVLHIENNYILTDLHFALLPFSMINTLTKRNHDLRWERVHRFIVKATIALFEAFRLPVYLILSIVDSLPHLNRAHSQFKKVKLIERVVAQMRRMRRQKRSRNRMRKE